MGRKLYSVKVYDNFFYLNGVQNTRFVSLPFYQTEQLKMGSETTD